MSKVALMAVAVMSLAAAQDAEMIDNPEYQGWKGQKAGAWVVWKTEMDMGGMKMDNTTTTKLKEITAEKAVIEETAEMDMGGQKRTMNLPARTLPAKIKKGTDSEGSKCEVTGEGDEELEVKGAKYKCHWVEMKVESKRGAMTLKVWRTDKIIGGAAKMTMKTKEMNMTRTVTDWKAGE